MSVYSPVVAGVAALAVSDWQSAAKLIEHTLLKPDATRNQIIALCQEASRYGFHAVMVNPANVALAAAQLRGTSVKVGTVVGFPLGASLTVTKLVEAENALRQGAHELDMVMNIGALKSGDRILVQTEMRSLGHLAHSHGGLLKVILENALLSPEEKILACALAAEAGADFVKTSSGLADSGATASDIASDARRGWFGDWGEGGRWHSHCGSPARNGGCRRQSHRYQRQRANHARNGRPGKLTDADLYGM